MPDFADITAKTEQDENAAPRTAEDEPAQPSGQNADEGANTDGGGGSGAVPQEDESTAQFEPVVQLEEVDVRTHEEDEDIIWKMRAKLFVYGETLLNKGTGQKEWVERGIGEIKFLQHKENSMVRLLMRQEKTMKVICNHVADPRIVLKPNAGSDRSWVWNAYDFTDGQLEEITFALRLGNSDSAKEFKEQFGSAQNIVQGLIREAPADSGEGDATPTGEAAASGEGESTGTADGTADATADALQKLSVDDEGTTSEQPAPTDA